MTHKARRLVLALLPMLSATHPALLAAQQPEATCTRDIVPCNWATYYSGTITWEGVRKVDQDRSRDGAVVGEDREVIKMQVTDGKAVCATSSRVREHMKFKSGKMVSAEMEKSSLDGAGILAVEFGMGPPGDAGQRWYRLRFACPVARGEKIIMDYRTMMASVEPPKKTEAPKLGKNDKTVEPQPDVSQGATLEGHHYANHPDYDSAKGITGQVSTEWSLQWSSPLPRPASVTASRP